jgi:hypothetical protein
METLILLLILIPLGLLVLVTVVLLLAARRIYRGASAALASAGQNVRASTLEALNRRGVSPSDLEEALRQSFSGAGLRILNLAERQGIDVVEAKRAFFARTRKLAKTLDSAVTLPVIGGVGLDFLLGLVPWGGDFVAQILALLVVINALEFGVPARLILRMLANVGVDFLLGLLPIVGDIVDLFNRSNNRNVRLLQRHLRESNKLQEV